MWIRLAQEEDIDMIEAIEIDCFNDAWHKKILKDMIDNKNDDVYILEDAGDIIGYINIRYILPEAEIMRVAIKKIYQGKKLSHLLIKRAISAMRTKGVTRCMLEVRYSNMPAIRLYKYYNFIEISRRKDYYTNPTEDALIYELDMTREDIYA